MAEEPMSIRVEQARKVFFDGQPKAGAIMFRNCAMDATTVEEHEQVHPVAVKCFRGAHMWKKAIYHQKMLIKALGSQPGTPENKLKYGDALLELAQIYKKATRTSQVEKTYRKALKLDGMSNEWREGVKDEYRAFLTNMGRLDEAQELDEKD